MIHKLNLWAYTHTHALRAAAPRRAAPSDVARGVTHWKTMNEMDYAKFIEENGFPDCYRLSASVRV